MTTFNRAVKIVKNRRLPYGPVAGALLRNPKAVSLSKEKFAAHPSARARWFAVGHSSLSQHRLAELTRAALEKTKAGTADFELLRRLAGNLSECSDDQSAIADFVLQPHVSQVRASEVKKKLIRNPGLPSHARLALTLRQIENDPDGDPHSKFEMWTCSSEWMQKLIGSLSLPAIESLA